MSLPWLAWLSAGSARWLFCRWPGRPPLDWGTGSTGGHCGVKTGEEQVSGGQNS